MNNFHDFLTLRCVRVPLRVLIILHVEQHGGDELIHVLRFPDDRLKFIINSLSDDTLETLNTRHTDPTVGNMVNALVVSLRLISQINVLAF